MGPTGLCWSTVACGNLVLLLWTYAMGEKQLLLVVENSAYDLYLEFKLNLGIFLR